MFALLAAAAIEGATILTGAGAILDRGTLVFKDGTITADSTSRRVSSMRVRLSA